MYKREKFLFYSQSYFNDRYNFFILNNLQFQSRYFSQFLFLTVFISYSKSENIHVNNAIKDFLNFYEKLKKSLIQSLILLNVN